MVIEGMTLGILMRHRILTVRWHRQCGHLQIMTNDCFDQRYDRRSRPHDGLGYGTLWRAGGRWPKPNLFCILAVLRSSSGNLSEVRCMPLVFSILSFL